MNLQYVLQKEGYLAAAEMRDRYHRPYYAAQRFDPVTESWDTVDDQLTLDEAHDVWREAVHGEPGLWRVVLIAPRVVSNDWTLA